MIKKTALIQLIFICSTLFSFNTHADYFGEMQQCGIKATKYLAVFAHPDDETWINGTLSKIARKGHPLSVVYATSGEAGSDRSGRGLTGDDLAAEREYEAQQALQALGVSNEPIFLHLPDGELTDITGLLSEQVETLINDTQADVVLTFGPGGVTGHPDHIAIGAATSLAFDRSATPTLLLNIAITEERAQGLSVIAAKYGISKYLPQERVNEEAINITVELDDFINERQSSPKYHVTQFPEPILDAWDEFVVTYPDEEIIISRKRDAGKGLEHTLKSRNF